jgi:hypothetical protein
VQLRFSLSRAADVQIDAPSGVSCSGRPVVTCAIGQLATGRSVRIAVTARPTRIRFYGLVAGAVAQSRDTNPRDNVAAALTRVRAQETPCGAAAGARARIAC